MPLAMPNIGDQIYVPGFAAKEEIKTWYDRQKEGGLATVSFVQQLNENEGCVFTLEYGAFSVWWSEICDIQDELCEKYEYKSNARIV